MSWRCEDYPCCGHTPQDPCDRQWYDEPGAFGPALSTRTTVYSVADDDPGRRHGNRPFLNRLWLGGSAPKKRASHPSRPHAACQPFPRSRLVGMQTTTTHQPGGTMPTTRISSDDAATKTMERLASEHGGTAFLSADIVATDGDGNPIVSVIHLEDRRHWNLVVRSELPQVGEVTKVAPVAKLPDALLTADDGDYIFVIGMQCSWTVTVQVLEPATI